MDTLHHSLIILSRTMSAAKDGGEEQSKAFKKLGVSVKDTKGNLRSAGDVMTDIQAKLSTLPDGAEKTALAMKLLGKSGADMIPFLDMDAEEMKAFNEASVMTPEQLAASKEAYQNSAHACSDKQMRFGKARLRRCYRQSARCSNVFTNGKNRMPT